MKLRKLFTRRPSRGRHQRPTGTETTSPASVPAALPKALADQPAIRSDVPDNKLWARSFHRLGELNGSLSPEEWERERPPGWWLTWPDQPPDPVELNHDGHALDWREQTMAELAPEVLERLADTSERALVPVHADYVAELDRQDQDAAAYLKQLAASVLAYRCEVSLSLAVA